MTIFSVVCKVVDKNHSISSLLYSFLYRGMAVNIAVMLGRLGVFLGNVIVPLLATINCELQFLTMALFHFGKNTILIFNYVK